MTTLQRIGIVVIGAAYIAQVALTVSSLLSGRGLPTTFFLNVFSLLLPTAFLTGEIRKRGPADAAERSRRRRAASAFGIGVALGLIVPAILFSAIGASGGDVYAVTAAVGVPVVVGGALLALSQLGATAPAQPPARRSSKRRR